MTKMFLKGTAGALALMMAACGANDDAVQNSENQAAAEPANAMTADANNPFAQSEMQMNERMLAAVGTDVGDSWVRKMIEHHQGAIDMARIVLQHNPRHDVAEMARLTVEKQGREVENLRKLVKPGSPDPRSGDVYRPGLAQMHSAMMAAKGADVSETFLRKMLEHHRGGVAISDVALQNGVGGALKQQVQKTRDEQRKEAEMIEAMLRGETMSHAAQPSKAAEPAKREPARPASEPAKAAPKPAPKPAPKAAPKPPATPPAPTCAPEHRAAGHC